MKVRGCEQWRESRRECLMFDDRHSFFDVKCHGGWLMVIMVTIGIKGEESDDSCLSCLLYLGQGKNLTVFCNVV